MPNLIPGSSPRRLRRWPRLQFTPTGEIFARVALTHRQRNNLDSASHHFMGGRLTESCRPLIGRHGNDGSDFQLLMEYGNSRYHLALLYNHDAGPCAVENVTLQKLYDAIERGDDDEVELATDECLRILWPFMKADYLARSDGSAISTVPGTNGVIRLKAWTVGGIFQSGTHDLVLNYPPNPPLENTFPGLPVFQSSDIERLHEQTMHIFKTRHNDALYSLKSVHRSLNKSFIREVSTLMTCSHPNIIGLAGVTVNSDGKVDGMLTNWIENARTISEMETISVEEAARWIAQIKNAVNYLHNNGSVWGDAKAANILVNMDGDAILVDFGGGFTDGWVEQRLCNTVEGDLQGLDRIVRFINGKIG